MINSATLVAVIYEHVELIFSVPLGIVLDRGSVFTSKF